MSIRDDRTVSILGVAADDTLPADETAIDDTLAVGTRLAGRYEILDLLGRGGMGTVYLATDDALDGKPVALKLVRPDLAGRQSIEAMRREVLLAQEVTHPSVCRVYDLEQAGSRWMIKMEYVEGETLSSRLADGPLTIAQALAIVRQVAGGLAAVHARGVVHRDLKPSNVMLGESGRVVLMDFGIAFVASHDRPSSEVAGTPPYMAPEQIRGEPVDARTDIYALGCVLYHLLVGEVPFPAATPQDSARLQLDQPPDDPRRRRPETPAWLARATLAMLAKDPAARPRDIASVQRLLAGPRRPGARAIGVGVAALAVATALVMVLALRRSSSHAWMPVLQLLPAFDENSYGPVLSPDGVHLAYVTDRDRKGHFKLHVAALDGSDDHVISPPDRSPLVVRWIDAGRALLFMDNGDWNLYRMDAAGGDAALVAAHAWGTGCGDGMLIVKADDDCANCFRMVVRDRDGAEREVAHFTDGDAPFDPVCDATGARAVYAYSLSGRDVYQPADLWLIDLATGARRALTDDHQRNLHPAFTPDGRSVVFTSARGGRMNLWELPLDGGAPVQRTSGEGNDVSPDLSSDGRTLAFDLDITSMPLFAHGVGDGSMRRLVPSRPMLASLAAVRDGATVVAVDRMPVTSQVVAIHLADGSLTELAAGAEVTVTPDGREAVFASDEDRGQVAAVALDGGAPRPIGVVDGRVRHVAVGPDGVVHLLVERAGGEEAWRLPLAGGAAERDAPAPWVLRAPSPDGATTLWLRRDGSGGSIAVLAPTGTTPEPSAPGVALTGTFAFDARGSMLVFRQGDAVYRLAVAGGAPERLFEVTELYGLAISPDGGTVYTSEVVARVQRALITNFADRPPL